MILEKLKEPKSLAGMKLKKCLLERDLEIAHCNGNEDRVTILEPEIEKISIKIVETIEDKTIEDKIIEDKITNEEIKNEKKNNIEVDKKIIKRMDWTN